MALAECQLVPAYLAKELHTSQVRRRLQYYQPGTLILREGGKSRHFYIIKSGEAKVSRSVEGKTVEIGILGPGDVIGLIGVIQDTPQFADVKAVQQTTLYRMDLQELIDTAGGSQQPVCSVLRALARKLRQAAEELTQLQVQMDDFQ